MLTIGVLLIATSLGGCVSFNCAGWKKFEPSRSDTAGTKAQALEHNEYGRAQHCWK
jgi:hypothetical protein